MSGKSLLIYIPLITYLIILSNQVYGKIVYIPSECKEYVEAALRDSDKFGSYTTVSDGLPAEVTYAAVAVAVIAIIAASVLATRKRT